MCGLVGAGEASVEIFTDWLGPTGAGQLLARWGHYLAGAAWLGLAYYFNFVQAPAFQEMSQQARSETLRLVSRRAERWVRWSALATLLSGVLILYFQRNLGSNFTDYFTTTRGTAVAFGVLLGVIMILNVWLVIFPNQTKVVKAAELADFGRGPDQATTRAAKKLARAERCNVVLSVPMLFFMAVGPHFLESAFRFQVNPGRDFVGMAWVVFIIMVGFIELSALGQIGGYDSTANRAMFDDYRHTIGWGFMLWALLWFGAFEAVLGRA
jgi:uncharacterized membrane protein